MIRILVVDDHAPFRRAIRRLLQRAGYDVVGEAEDGRSAVAANATLEPDVVLLDIQLPDQDGFTVARALAASSHPPTVVLCSSRDASDYGPLLDGAAARGFVPKAELSPERLHALLASTP